MVIQTLCRPFCVPWLGSGWDFGLDFGYERVYTHALLFVCLFRSDTPYYVDGAIYSSSRLILMLAGT